MRRDESEQRKRGNKKAGKCLEHSKQKNDTMLTGVTTIKFELRKDSKTEENQRKRMRIVKID